MCESRDLPSSRFVFGNRGSRSSPCVLESCNHRTPKASFEGVSNLSITFRALVAMTPCLFVLPLATTNPEGRTLILFGTKPVYVKSNRGQGKFDTHLLQATETETMQISFALQDTKDSFYNPFSLRIDAPPSAGSELGPHVFHLWSSGTAFYPTPLFKAAAILESGI